MAYVLDEEDEEGKAGGPGVVAGNPVGSLMGPSAPGWASGTPASASGMPSQTGTDFVGWDRILAANKDAAKASADKMANRLGQAGADVRTGLGAAQGQFGADLAKGDPTPKAPPTTGSVDGPGAGEGRTGVNSFGQPTGTPRGGQAPPASMPQAAQPQAQPQQPQGPLVFTGPGSLSEGAGWDDLLKSGAEAQRNVGATQQRDGNGNLRGEAGIEALLREQQQGNYTQGQSRMDAALLGTTGRRRFGELQKDYGGLMSDLRAADKASRVQSDAVRTKVEGANADADRIAAERKAALEAGLGPRATPEDRSAFEGKEDYDTYMGTGGLLEGHNLEHTIRDIGRFLNPVSAAIEAGNGRSLEDVRTPYYEEQFNKQFGTNHNSAALQLDRLLPGVQPGYLRALYETLTTAEVKWLEQQGHGTQRDFLQNRLKDVAKKMQTKEAWKQGVGKLVPGAR